MTYIQVVEQGDIEREGLPPFHRIRKTQISKEILLDFLFRFVEFGRKEHDVQTNSMNDRCDLLNQDARRLCQPNSCLAAHTDSLPSPGGESVQCF